MAFCCSPRIRLKEEPSRNWVWPEQRYLWFRGRDSYWALLNPLVNELRPVVERLFPVSSIMKASLAELLSNAPSLGVSIVIFALIPAICEEFAFRGFILSGLEHEHRTRSAILLSALMFGFLHVLLSLFQQLFNATLLGMVLGLLAVRSRSILPGIVFHFLNNAIAVALGSVVHASWAAGIVRLGSIATRMTGFIMGAWLDGERVVVGGLVVLFVEVEIESTMRRDSLTIGARYVYPVEGPPIENGCLTIDAWSDYYGWVG